MRHGETEWNAEQRLQGHDNSQLSQRGISQAKAFTAYLRSLAPARVVCSDLGRTRHTAELIGHRDAPCDPRLRELHMGEWTGQTKPDLIAAHSDNYHSWRAGSFTPPQGETWADFRARIGAGLRDWLRRGEGDLLAVVHGGVVRAACHEFLGLPPSMLVPVTPGTATILHFDPAANGAARLEAYNIGAVAPDLAVAD